MKATIILSDGQPDLICYDEQTAVGHMCDLHAMGCRAQRVNVAAAKADEAYDHIEEYCRDDTRASMRSPRTIKQWEWQFRPEGETE